MNGFILKGKFFVSFTGRHIQLYLTTVTWGVWSKFLGGEGVVDGEGGAVKDA